MASSADPDQMPRSAASDLGLHCLFRPNCPITWGKYAIYRRGKFTYKGKDNTALGPQRNFNSSLTV